MAKFADFAVHILKEPIPVVSFSSKPFHFSEIGCEYNAPFAKLLIENIPYRYYYPKTGPYIVHLLEYLYSSENLG